MMLPGQMYYDIRRLRSGSFRITSLECVGFRSSLCCGEKIESEGQYVVLRPCKYVGEDLAASTAENVSMEVKHARQALFSFESLRVWMACYDEANARAFAEMPFEEGLYSTIWEATSKVPAVHESRDAFAAVRNVEIRQEGLEEFIANVCEMVGLRQVTFDRCTLTSLHIDMLAGGRGVEFLCFVNCNMEEAGVIPFSQFRELREVKITSGSIAATTLSELGKCSSLESIELSYLDGIAVGDVAAVNAVRRISLTHCNIAEPALTFVSACSACTQLTMVNCGIDDNSVCRLGALNNLVQVDVSGNDVGDVTLRRFAEMKTLMGLRCFNTCVTLEGVMEARSRRPECLICV